VSKIGRKNSNLPKSKKNKKDFQQVGPRDLFVDSKSIWISKKPKPFEFAVPQELFMNEGTQISIKTSQGTSDSECFQGSD